MAKVKRKHRDGYRYEVCRKCGDEWNISRGQYIPLTGYLCPVCTYVRKGGRANENSTKNGGSDRKRRS